jgi:hypothetical protein
MLTPEQKKAKKEFKKNRKVKKWRRRARCRFLKNLLIWFVGFISSIGIVGGSFYLAVGVVPLNNFLGNDESIVKNEIANGTLLSLIQSIGTYTIGDVPVLNDAILGLIEGIGLEDMITIDTNKISSIPFSSLSDGSFTDTLIGAVSFDATFKGVSDKLGFSLGDFSNLEVFTTYQEVPPANKPTEADYTASDFDHNSFYYMAENGTPPVYAPAFKDNAPVNGVSDSTTLYYPALNDVPIMSFFTQLSSALDRVKVKDLVNTLGGGSDTSIINKIIGDTTIGNIGTFDHNTILLNDILPESSNTALYKILKDATSITDGTKITVGDLDGIDINEVKLETVLPKTEIVDGEPVAKNENIWKILNDAITLSNEDDEIRIKDLGGSSFDINNVKLSTVVGEKDTTNEDLYKILVDATGKDWDKITLLEVKSVNIDNVKLETVFSRTENEATWAILDEIVVKPESSPTDYKITVSDLGNIKVENLSLETAIGEETDSNKDLYAILRDLTGGKSTDEMTVSDVKSININEVKLETVLPNNSDNANIWNILGEAITPSDEDGAIRIKDLGGSSFDINNVKLETVLPNTSDNANIWKILNEAISARPVTIGSLSSFEIGNVNLLTVLTDSEGNVLNEKLWNIIEEAISDEYKVDGKITVNSLEHFDVDNIPLTTVIDKNTTTNDVLKALLEVKDSTLGNIGNNLSTLKLRNIYDIHDFTTIKEEPYSSPAYKKTSKTNESGTHDYYVLESLVSSPEYSDYVFEEETYYISHDSRIWLLLLYDADDAKDDIGNAKTYLCKDLTLGNINTTIANASDCFMSATIKMLVDTGILFEEEAEPYEKIYALSVEEVFKNANIAAGLV